MRFFSRRSGGTAQEWEAPQRPLTAAIITMARDEGPMLQAWVRHHAGLVGAAHLVVLDDSSTDGSAEAVAAQGVTVHHLPSLTGKPFERTRMRILSGIATGLLHAYDYVVALDADELLVVDPAFGTLDAFLRARDCPETVGVVGLNVVHTPGEAPLDLSRPITEQRAHAIFAPGMCKPSLKRVPARWGLASHGIAAPYVPDPGVLMLHLKFADRDRLLAISAARHQAFLDEGRAKASTWSKPADDIVAVLDQAVAGLGEREVAEFDPGSIDLAGLIVDDNGVRRPVRQGQLEALLLQEPTRIPTRFKGLA
ncbi:glycosyltransferase family 2 protein [Nocardioides sp.]|uniref:glycosyltransferase family 2 protein n=1 Tax=Nocardioides sp. TaxID=35761 RepID=UPI002617ABEE|nr:glycosyltransferase family 2 protein [Nocardioides sp.]